MSTTMNEINPSTRGTLKRFGTTCRLLAIFCVTALGFQANVAMALPALYVHYDASDATSVTLAENIELG